jgi:hypothetical protein
MCLTTPNVQRCTLSRTLGLGFSRFVRHYYGNSIFSSGYLDVSVPPLAPSLRGPTYHGRGLPHSEIFGSDCKRLPEAYRSVTTSFVGPVCLGIHHLPLFACANLSYVSLPPLITGLSRWEREKDCKNGQQTCSYSALLVVHNSHISVGDRLIFL